MGISIRSLQPNLHVDYIETKRKIVLVERRLTLDIVAEQEYYRHCLQENLQIWWTASSEICTFRGFEEIARKIKKFFNQRDDCVCVFVHKLILKCTPPPN